MTMGKPDNARRGPELGNEDAIDLSAETRRKLDGRGPEGIMATLKEQFASLAGKATDEGRDLDRGFGAVTDIAGQDSPAGVSAARGVEAVNAVVQDVAAQGEDLLDEAEQVMSHNYDKAFELKSLEFLKQNQWEKWGQHYSGELSPNGFMLDKNGNETTFRPSDNLDSASKKFVEAVRAAAPKDEFAEVDVGLDEMLAAPLPSVTSVESAVNAGPAVDVAPVVATVAAAESGTSIDQPDAAPVDVAPVDVVTTSETPEQARERMGKRLEDVFAVPDSKFRQFSTYAWAKYADRFVEPGLPVEKVITSAMEARDAAEVSQRLLYYKESSPAKRLEALKSTPFVDPFLKDGKLDVPKLQEALRMAFGAFIEGGAKVGRDPDVDPSEVDALVAEIGRIATEKHRLTDEEFNVLLTDEDEERFKAAGFGMQRSPDGSRAFDDKKFLLSAKEYMEQFPEGEWKIKLGQTLAKKNLDGERGAIAELEAKLKKAKGREKISLMDELEATKRGYEAHRAEFVGDNAGRMLGERLRLEELRVKEVVENRSGWDKFGKKLYDAYKWLGDKNLEGWVKSKTDNKFLQKLGKVASLRTVVNATLGGLAVWGGAGLTIGASAFALRRVMSGAGAAFGSYDAMRQISDRGMMDATPESVKKMSKEQVLKQMEAIEAKARVSGDPKLLDGNAAYEALRYGLREKFKEDGPGAMLKSYIDDADGNIARMAKKRAGKDKLFMVAAAGVGLFVGGGFLGAGIRKLFGGSEALTSQGDVAKSAAKTAKASVVEAARTKPATDLSYKDAYGSQEKPMWNVEKSMAPVKTMSLKTDAPPVLEQVTFSDAEASAPSSDATPSLELGDTRAPSSDLPPPGAPDAAPLPDAGKVKAGLDLVGKGDGYVKVFTRQIEADPAKFGFDPAKDGDPTKWAKKLAGKIAKEQGLMDRGLRAGARVTLDPDHKVNLSEGGDYVRQPKVDLGQGSIGGDFDPTKVLEDFAKEPFRDPQGRVTSLSFGPGYEGSARFTYGDMGIVKDMQIDGARMPTDAEIGEVLKEDWMKKVADSRMGIGNFEQAKADLAQKVSRLRAMAELEKRFEAEGEGNTAAAQFLRKRMKLEMMVINKDFLGAVSDDMARDVNSRINEAAKVIQGSVPREGVVNEVAARPKFEASTTVSEKTTTLEDGSAATYSQNQDLKGSVFAPFEGEAASVAVPPETAAVAPKPERPVAKFFKSIGNWFKDAGKAIVNIPKATGENMQNTMEQNQAMRDATSDQRNKDYWDKFGGKGPGANPPDVKR